jgi:hypothetical protein
MKLQDQVITLDQAKRLKELGVKQESHFYHHPNFEEPTPGRTSVKKHGTMYKVTQVKNDLAVTLSAFSVAELGAIIGKGTNAAALFYDAVLDQMNRSHSFTIALSVQFVANCVIGMLETGRLTIDEVNARLCENR